MARRRQTKEGPPDLGAWRAAAMLTERLGLQVTIEGVHELARCGLIPGAGYYKGWPLYDRAALEAFADKDAAAEAMRAGKLRTADQAAAYLKVRRADLNHLTRCKALKPAGHAPNPNNRRCDIPLYRTADLDRLLARADIDWAAVRATPKGRPSLLIRVAEAENILAVLAGLPFAPDAGQGAHDRAHPARRAGRRGLLLPVAVLRGTWHAVVHAAWFARAGHGQFQTPGSW